MLKQDRRRSLKDWNVSCPVLYILSNVHNKKVGRTIFDAVRTVEDILEYTERFKISGRLIAIDFKKAFDSVSREFLFRTLSAARFGSSFIQWIHTFYNNISSCVPNNGFATAHFDIQRG